VRVRDRRSDRLQRRGLGVSGEPVRIGRIVRTRQRLRLDTAEPAQNLIGWYERRGYHPVGEVRWSGKTYDSIVMETDLSKVAD